LKFRVHGSWFRVGGTAFLVAILLPAAAFGGEADTEEGWVAAVYREFYAGDLRGALTRYEESVDADPKNPHAADALLRAAFCREKLGDLDGALKLALRVKLEYPRAASACSRAEEIQKRLEGRAAWKREREGFVRENEKLRLLITDLSQQLEKALTSLQKGARDEEERKREVVDLKERIDGLNLEKIRLKKKLEAHAAGNRPEAGLSPEEVLERAEEDLEVRKQVTREMAEHWFQTGLKHRAEEKLDEAKAAFEKCLELWEEHPKAREHLLRIGALQGDPKSLEEALLRRLEIRKEIRILEKKRELGETFRVAFELYRAEDYGRAEVLFLTALNILARDLPEGPEFDRQKDLAARYHSLCREQSNRVEGGGAGARLHSLEVLIHVASLPHGRLDGFAREADLQFARTLGPGAPALYAALEPAQFRAFHEILESEGRTVVDEKTLLVTRTKRVLQKFLEGPEKPTPGFSLQITPRLVGVRPLLLVSLNILHAHTRKVRLPGREGVVAVPEFFSQHFTAELQLPPKGGLLLAGPRNPFRKGGMEEDAENPEDLVVVIEGVG
jgi:TolA-binding protein